MAETSLGTVIHRIRRRALAAKISGYVFLFLVLFTAYLAVIFFSSVDLGRDASSGQYRFSIDTIFLKASMETTATREGEQSKIVSETEILLRSITSARVRIGAVLLAVFVIQHLVSFARYNFQVSEHLSSCADSLVLSGGDPESMAQFADNMSVAGIGFVKMPQYGYEKIMESVKDMAAKIKPGS